MDAVQLDNSFFYYYYFNKCQGNRLGFFRVLNSPAHLAQFSLGLLQLGNYSVGLYGPEGDFFASAILTTVAI